MFSVSHTTRPMRGNERDGVDYHFVDDKTFDELVAKGAFLEWAHVHGNRYGTTRDAVTAHLNNGVDVFFDIDVQGGRQIAERMPGAVLVFVLPPNIEVLERRLRARATDVEAQIQRRLAATRSEIESAIFYTYWLVNDDLDHATREMCAIIMAERIRRNDKMALTQALTRGGG